METVNHFIAVVGTLPPIALVTVIALAAVGAVSWVSVKAIGAATKERIK
jgi:hypothetical protein